MAEDRELVGIKGWLLVFLITLGVITPIDNLVAVLSLTSDPNMAAAYGDQWSSLQRAEWILVLITCAGCWFLVWRMVNVRRWSSVQLTIPGLWILTVGGLVAETIAVKSITGIPLDALISGMGAELVRPFVYSIVWSAYLATSKRVKNTYPKQGSEEEIAEVFG